MYKMKFYGLGGQGVVTAGKILCHAYCYQKGKYAKALPAFGHERRGGLVETDVIIDEQPILINSFIYDPNVIALFSEGIQENTETLGGIQEGAILILNTSHPPVMYHPNISACYYVDASGLSLKVLAKNIPNIGMLAALSRAGIACMDALNAALDILFVETSDDYKKLMERAYHETNRI